MLASLINVLISAATITEYVPATALFLIVLVVFSAITYFHDYPPFLPGIYDRHDVQCEMLFRRIGCPDAHISLPYGRWQRAVGLSMCMNQGYCSPGDIRHTPGQYIPYC